MAKRRRKPEPVCRCGAYEFPHRFGGGRCNGLGIVVHNVGGSACQSCNLMCDGCQVISGQEHPRECYYVQDFAASWEIKI